MVRYNLLPLVMIAALSVLTFAGSRDALANTTWGLNMYGFPVDIVPAGSTSAEMAGQGYSYDLAGYALPDFGTTYGFEAHEVSPALGGISSYVGPELNGIDLGVAFGLTQANHDNSTTSFSKDLYYESSLDNTFIGFPGIGVGSLGVNFPTITNQKSDIKYMESVKFEFSTESDTFQVSGFGFPLGLGLGYTSAIAGMDSGLNILNLSFLNGNT